MQDLADRELQEKIEQAIQAHLPAQVGDVLRKRLEQADKDARQIELQRQELKAVYEARNKESERAKMLEEQLAGHDALNLRERLVGERETKIEIESLKVQLAAQQRIADSAWAFLNALSKNAIVREHASKSIFTQSTFVNGSETRYPTGESVTAEKIVE